MNANTAEANINSSLDRRLPPIEAIKYLREVHGIRRTLGSLANFRVSGTGPRFYKEGNSRGGRILYRIADLDLWAQDILGGPRTSTSEAA